jgi:leucyl aminopeptidase
MKTILSLSPAAQLETECLVAVVLDQGEKAKVDAYVSADKAVQQAAADLLSTGDLTGKPFEVAWLHKPAGLKAKRLLLIGGGKSKKFSSTDLRKLAGAAVRALKPRTLRSLAFILPAEISAEDAQVERRTVRLPEPSVLHQYHPACDFVVIIEFQDASQRGCFCWTRARSFSHFGFN